MKPEKVMLLPIYEKHEQKEKKRVVDIIYELGSTEVRLGETLDLVACSIREKAVLNEIQEDLFKKAISHIDELPPSAFTEKMKLVLALGTWVNSLQ